MLGRRAAARPHARRHRHHAQSPRPGLEPADDGRDGQRSGDALMDVRPGERLAFMRALMKARKWPPSRIPRRRTDVPSATPYIVVPADANDDGARPIDPQRANHGTAIEVVDAAGSL